MATGWTTAALTKDLSERMTADRWLVAREATVAEPVYQRESPYGQIEPGARADLLCMKRRLDVQPMLICEVKVSRADLLADLRAEKWRAYLKVAAVAFAFPAWLDAVHKIPAQAGVIIRQAKHWRWMRPPNFDAAPAPSPYLYRRLALTVADQYWIDGRNTERRRVLEQSAPAGAEVA